MHFLLSNDDGYQSPGLVAMACALEPVGTVTVVAPDRDRSGASNSLTLDSPVRPMIADNGFIYVNGTPTDCVHLAITGLLNEEPDMVISGINNGSNLGDDVLYSGTVAAAMEGRYLGCPAIAVSLASEHPQHYDTAIRVMLKLVNHFEEFSFGRDILLNINIPDIPYKELAGYEVTRLGQRHKSEPAISATDPKGRTVYWVGPVGPEQDGGAGTDFHAIKYGKVSITPLQVDITRYNVIKELTDWVGSRIANE